MSTLLWCAFLQAALAQHLPTALGCVAASRATPLLSSLPSTLAPTAPPDSSTLATSSFPPSSGVGTKLQQQQQHCIVARALWEGLAAVQHSQLKPGSHRPHKSTAVHPSGVQVHLVPAPTLPSSTVAAAAATAGHMYEMLPPLAPLLPGELSLLQHLIQGYAAVWEEGAGPAWDHSIHTQPMAAGNWPVTCDPARNAAAAAAPLVQSHTGLPPPHSGTAELLRLWAAAVWCLLSIGAAGGTLPEAAAQGGVQALTAEQGGVVAAPPAASHAAAVPFGRALLRAHQMQCLLATAAALHDSKAAGSQRRMVNFKGLAATRAVCVEGPPACARALMPVLALATAASAPQAAQVGFTGGRHGLFQVGSCMGSAWAV